MPQKRAGNVAVISGGTTGIGLVTAWRFAAEGAHVFLFGRRKAQLDEGAKLIGGNVTAMSNPRRLVRQNNVGVDNQTIRSIRG
jgi:NADP-dependent 3-hydroxy acid dehydrogenase YdfG